jgi:hypothetical protein
MNDMDDLEKARAAEIVDLIRELAARLKRAGADRDLGSIPDRDNLVEVANQVCERLSHVVRDEEIRTIPVLDRYTGDCFGAVCCKCVHHEEPIYGPDAAKAWAKLQSLGWTTVPPTMHEGCMPRCPQCTAHPEIDLLAIAFARSQAERVGFPVSLDASCPATSGVSV